MPRFDDPNFWLAAFTVGAIVAVTAAATMALRYIAFKLAHWLGDVVATTVPPPLGGWMVTVVRFFYAAALFCGLTAFVLSFMIWRAPWPPSGADDPILRNPLFWLTWLALTAAIMLLGIVAGGLVRNGLARALAGFRKAIARKPP